MFNGLKESVAIITGAGGGLGKAEAKRLAKEGCKIFAVDIMEPGLEKMKAEFAAEGLNDVYTYVCDGSKEEEVKAAIAKCLEVYGDITILVNNAGIYTHHLVEEMSFEDWDATMKCNLYSVFYFCREVLATMKKNHYGKIINLASQAGVSGSVTHAHYAASKGGIISFSRSLALEVAKDRINVNCVAPGIIKTAMTAKYTPEQEANFTRQIPLGYFAEPDEVAKVVEFLASDGSDYLTAQVYNVTGGWLRIS